MTILTMQGLLAVDFRPGTAVSIGGDRIVSKLRVAFGEDRCTLSVALRTPDDTYDYVGKVTTEYGDSSNRRWKLDSIVVDNHDLIQHLQQFEQQEIILTVSDHARYDSRPTHKVGHCLADVVRPKV